MNFNDLLDHMASLTTTLLLLSGVSFVLSSLSPSRCGPNEHFEECGRCEGTCGNPVCLLSDCGPPKCNCDDGFVRGENGTCIPLAACPPPSHVCPEGEYWSECSSCDATCEDIFPICKFNVLCKKRCACLPDLVRSPEGKCVEKYSCGDINFPCYDVRCGEDEACVNVPSKCTKYGCSKKAVCIKNDCLAKQI
ncbi:hypothetical protein QR680_006294 [Steinernema hermaphroditum]|uniref:TIL domain-containing protein n=1 Tax=Steinernema hermaphroditum TaxID=289476 RepID=A0AA39LX60_9BILA|nr:hypothetical protein QR680_006294 [Steinernema hermaphroditum]